MNFEVCKGDFFAVRLCGWLGKLNGILRNFLLGVLRNTKIEGLGRWEHVQIYDACSSLTNKLRVILPSEKSLRNTVRSS